MFLLSGEQLATLCATTCRTTLGVTPKSDGLSQIAASVAKRAGDLCICHSPHDLAPQHLHGPSQPPPPAPPKPAPPPSLPLCGPVCSMLTHLLLVDQGKNLGVQTGQFESLRLGLAPLSSNNSTHLSCMTSSFTHSACEDMQGKCTFLAGQHQQQKPVSSMPEFGCSMDLIQLVGCIKVQGCFKMQGAECTHVLSSNAIGMLA